MKNRKLLALGLLATMWAGSAQAQTVNSDYWAATDALGRTVGTYDGVKKDKKVIMFYWTWHEMEERQPGMIRNVSKILHEHPEALKDEKNPAWSVDGNPIATNYWWDEPLLGYYVTTDEWVLRKHAEMLADAKVDAVMFDCTNGSLTWDASTEALMKVWDQAQKDGVNVPKIGFMLPFGPFPHSLTSLRHLWETIYSKGRYKNLWFYWDGKPCIMAYSDNLTDSKEDQKIKKFFTFRPGQPDYVDGPMPGRDNQWGWLENYPQHGYVTGKDGKSELVTVGVAQNACRLVDILAEIVLIGTRLPIEVALSRDVESALRLRTERNALFSESVSHKFSLLYAVFKFPRCDCLLVRIAADVAVAELVELCAANRADTAGNHLVIALRSFHGRVARFKVVSPSGLLRKFGRFFGLLGNDNFAAIARIRCFSTSLGRIIEVE